MVFKINVVFISQSAIARQFFSLHAMPSLMYSRRLTTSMYCSYTGSAFNPMWILKVLLRMSTVPCVFAPSSRRIEFNTAPRGSSNQPSISSVGTSITKEYLSSHLSVRTCKALDLFWCRGESLDRLAGFHIEEGMESRIRGYKQAVRKSRNMVCVAARAMSAFDNYLKMKLRGTYAALNRVCTLAVSCLRRRISCRMAAP
ncbi:hypothetical protein B0J14DRAFT_208859 [Halenospora varia]|nr:hypothetical protein B0J14DRAFT_208859 [Halenospora varia]